MERHNNQCSGMKARLLISYGGKLLRRKHDKVLFYIGGAAKVVALDRNIKYMDIVTTVVFLCDLNTPCELKYLSPESKDLDEMVSLDNDEDVENMMKEYDNIHLSTANKRLFVLQPTTKSQRVPLQRSDSLNPDYLFGFDKEYDPNATLEKLDVPEFLDELDFRLNQGNQKEKHVAYLKENNVKEQEVEKKKHLTTKKTQGTMKTTPCDDIVTSEPINYAYTTHTSAPAPLIYWVPFLQVYVEECGELKLLWIPINICFI